MQKTKRVSMQDIADRLQISKNAVSLALNNKPGVSDETRELVIALAKKLHYKNFSEDSLQAGSKNILVFIPEYIRNDSFFYNDIYWSVDYRASQKGFNAVMSTITDEMQTNKLLPSICDEMDFLGFLLIGVLQNDYVQFLMQQKSNIISVDHIYYGIELKTVGTSNLMGSYILTQKVISYGHTRIGFIGASQMTSSIYERWCGFQKAMENAKLPINPQYNIHDDSPLDNLLSDAEDVLLRLNSIVTMPTAFVCASDRTAIAVITALKQLGYQVPSDISVVGFDDIELGRYTEPQLTTMHVKRKEMGRLAVDLLLKEKESKNHVNTYAIEPELICRNSLTWASAPGV